MNPTSLADCPHRPGTPEWAEWQRQWIGAEGRRRQATGTAGATRAEKVAAGLADADTHMGRDSDRYGRPLSQYPEPWRTALVEHMRSRALAGPLRCHWCARPYKTDRGARRHSAGCWLNPDCDLYVTGEWEPIVDLDGRITGRTATDSGRSEWATRRAASEAARSDLADRFGRDAVVAVAKALTNQGTREYRALRLLARLEAAGWKLTRTEP